MFTIKLADLSYGSDTVLLPTLTPAQREVSGPRKWLLLYLRASYLDRHAYIHKDQLDARILGMIFVYRFKAINRAHVLLVCFRH